MGSLFIQTEVDSQRVLAEGQPSWETIELDASVDYEPLVITPYLETARFSDFCRNGGESLRYYHLTDYGRGLCLSLPPSGEGRIISGTYSKREICIARAPVELEKIYSSEADPSRPINAAARSHLYLLLRPKGVMIARFNCLESFDKYWFLSASLRIPECLLHGHPSSSAFAATFARHQVMDQPCAESLAIKTIDATLAVKTEKVTPLNSAVQLQIGSQVIDLPLLSTPMML